MQCACARSVGNYGFAFVRLVVAHHGHRQFQIFMHMHMNKLFEVEAHAGAERGMDGPVLEYVGYQMEHEFSPSSRMLSSK